MAFIKNKLPNLVIFFLSSSSFFLTTASPQNQQNFIRVSLPQDFQRSSSNGNSRHFFFRTQNGNNFQFQSQNIKSPRFQQERFTTTTLPTTFRNQNNFQTTEFQQQFQIQPTQTVLIQRQTQTPSSSLSTSEPFFSEQKNEPFVQGQSFEFSTNSISSNQPPQSEAVMSETCLACICKASTDCNLSTQCIQDGKYCGPFLMSRPYWLDAGMPTLDGDNPERRGAFEDCATDPVCASRAVKQYMNRYKRDCNNNFKVDCHDLSLIHFYGPESCSRPNAENILFFQRVKQCLNRVERLNGK